jgi:hypothetical protein
MAYYVVGPDGKETGPVSLDELVGWVRSGQLPRHAPVRDEGSQSPVQAGQMIELAGQFPPEARRAASGNAVIPTGNPDALWAYYLGWLSLLCVIGLIAAPFAFIKASKGMKAYERDPSVHGKAHVMVGRILAVLGTLGNLALVWFVVQGIANA